MLLLTKAFTSHLFLVYVCTCVALYSAASGDSGRYLYSLDAVH